MVSRKASILLVEDEVQMLRLLRRTLELEGYRPLVAETGDGAIHLLEEEGADLILLDIMLPGMDGFAVCKSVREFSSVPIIMLTAKGGEHDKLRAFDLCIDDYISKPFSMNELLARIKAVLRRGEGRQEISTPAVFRHDDLEVDFRKRSVVLSDTMVSLTPTEFGLLKELVVNRGKVLTYPELLKRVWGPEYREERQYLHVFVGRLRAKIERGRQRPGLIRNVFGVGYEFVET